MIKRLKYALDSQNGLGLHLYLIFSTRKAISFIVHVKGCPGLSLMKREALWARRIYRNTIKGRGGLREPHYKWRYLPSRSPFFLKL